MRRIAILNCYIVIKLFFSKYQPGEIMKKSTDYEYLAAALSGYDKVCETKPAGARGLRRRTEFFSLIHDEKSLSLKEVCEFYKKEKVTGLTEPRLTQHLREALFLIFNIPKEPSNFKRGTGTFGLLGSAIEQKARIKYRMQCLDDKIEEVINKNTFYTGLS